MTKDYTSTLARMAGNIAAGLVGEGEGHFCDAWMNDERKERVAECAVDLADRILAKCIARAAARQAAR